MIEVDDTLLSRWPLPKPDDVGDKECRGHIMVVAGSREMPGAALLSATTTLRVGAGKLVIATPSSIAALVASSIPEARVIAIPDDATGNVLAAGAATLDNRLTAVDAVLLGPGWAGSSETLEFVRAVLAAARKDLPVVLDAAAMDALFDRSGSASVVVTPHAGEMAHLLGLSKDEVTARPGELALEAARSWNCLVVLKGAATHIASPSGESWRHRCVIPGLGTSGSGDVLAGAIAGLCARGATVEQAAVWGVTLHARAGKTLQDRMAPIGYLARELMQELPALMRSLAMPIEGGPNTP